MGMTPCDLSPFAPDAIDKTRGRTRSLRRRLPRTRLERTVRLHYGGPVKTNAARILDRLKIRYELKDYEVDESDLTAGTVARRWAAAGASVQDVLRGGTATACASR